MDAGAWRARVPGHRPVSSARPHAHSSRKARFGLRKASSEPKARVQPDRVKSSCSITDAWECERGRANVLSLSRHVPSRAGQTDTQIYEGRGAEAPGQRTARGRLL